MEAHNAKCGHTGLWNVDRKMLRRILLGVILAGAVGVGIFWWLTIPAVVASASLPPRAPNLANGLTTFNAGGCSSCHAVPNQPDRLKLGGGLAIPSPFGTFYVPNISSDPTYGIGRWSEADFVTAMLKGTSPDGAHYFPAFPYASYQHATVEDIRDLFAYLKTLAPVSGKPRDHEVPFPFSIRRNVGIWKWLFMDGKPYTADASQSAAWNRGAYLVNGPGHCAECHSPRNFLGGIVTAQRFAGGPNPEGEGWVPNITQKRLAEWSAIAAGGSRRDGGISEVAAAGRRTAAAPQGKGCREVIITGALRLRSGRQGCGDRHSPLWRRRGHRRQDGQRFAQHRRGDDFSSPRIRGRLGWSNPGERAVEIADTDRIQNDAAVETGGCEARIILNRQIV
jgi:mono/diheme cytochrome c family protein